MTKYDQRKEQKEKLSNYSASAKCYLISDQNKN